jgi:hypothetical protein
MVPEGAALKKQHYMRSLQQAAYADMFPTLYLLPVNVTACIAGFTPL